MVFRGPVDPRSDAIYILAYIALCLAGWLVFFLVVGVVMLVGRYGFQEAATRVQVWGEAAGEIAGFSLVIAGGVALAALIIYIGIKVFSS